MLPINPFSSDAVQKETLTEQKVESYDIKGVSGWAGVKRIFEVEYVKINSIKNLFNV